MSDKEIKVANLIKFGTKAFVVMANKQEPNLYILKIENIDDEDYSFKMIGEYKLKKGSHEFNSHYISAFILNNDLLVYVVT